MFVDGGERILVLSPHTDDAEFGCGGTIARLSESCVIYYVIFSIATKSVRSGLPPDVHRREAIRAVSGVLGVCRLLIARYEARTFDEHRQSILEQMVNLNSEIRPSMVFMPSSSDTHQDHAVIANEGFRAFKKSSILGYEMPWNNLSFKTAMFVSLDDAHMEKKQRAISCYSSQMHRHYFSNRFVEGLARVRGTQIGVEFAEAFEVLRMIL